MSPEAQPKARLPSSPYSPLSFSALPSSSDEAPVFSELGRSSETQSSESPSVFSSSSSPIVAPISTSTPIEHWLPTGQGQASSEEPSLLLKAELQKESLTPVPNTMSSALGSLLQQPPVSAWKEMEDSSRGKISETGKGKNASSHEPGKPLPEHPVAGQPKELLKFPSPTQDHSPSSKEAHEVPFVLSLSSGRNVSLAGKPPLEGDNRVKDGGVTSATEEALPPFDAMMQKQEEMGLNGSEGQKRVKKRVSFSEQLFTEEEAGKHTWLGEEEKSHPQEVTSEGTAEGKVPGAEPPGCPHTEDSERESVAVAQACRAPAPTEDRLLAPSSDEGSSEDPTGEASSAKGTPLFRIEGDDALIAQCQSKASDHEGLLSDPLNGLRSASDVKSPIMADLNLTLPSIPEVASDDERVDQVEDDRKTAKLAEAGASPSVTLPPCLETGRGLSGGADGLAPMESLPDCRSEAPTAAPPEQMAALGIHEPHLGKSSSVDKQLPGPGSGEEDRPKGGGRPSQPPGTSLDSPVPSPSLSETFPAIHCLPSSPHSNTHHTSTAESQKKATAEGSAGKVDNFGKRKPLLQAWVSPSETHPVSAQPGAGTGATKHR